MVPDRGTRAADGGCLMFWFLTVRSHRIGNFSDDTINYVVELPDNAHPMAFVLEQQRQPPGVAETHQFTLLFYAPIKASEYEALKDRL